MRYERKFRIENSSYEGVRNEILSNPACFKLAYPDRTVNSIYYDDLDYTAYNDNLLGVGERVKYRVRWYGDDMQEVKQPVLEKKIKKNLLGKKEHYALADFHMKQGAPRLPDHITYAANQLYPYIIVRYRRTYFVSINGNIRATIDRKLQYYDLFQRRISSSIHTDPAIILEIKYGQDKTEEASECITSLPYRLTKNSKYVSAMSLYLQ